MIEDLEIFRATLDQSAEGIIIYDDQNKVIYCNQAFCTQLGFHKLEILHQHIKSFVPDAFHERLDKILQNKRESVEQEFSFDKPMVNKMGNQVWFKVLSRSFTVQKKVYWASYYRNEIEQNKQKELILENSKKINEYTFLISHKLRHPIANIQGLINLFDTENLSNPEHASLIEYLRQASFQLNEVVHEINNSLNAKQHHEELSIFPKPGFLKTLMLVDDDSINHFITKSIITRVDPKMQILSFSNPRHALQYLGTGNNLPDLILLDLGLRWMSEWDFMEACLNLQLSQIPCYIFSNMVEAVDKANAKNYPNFKDFVLKPITTEKLESLFAGTHVPLKP